MKKPTELRAWLAEKVPHLAKHPDRLQVFIEKGRLASRLGSLSFEYRYELQLLFTDFTDHADTLMIPLLAWLQVNQPELLQSAERQDSAIRFEAEILDNEKTDILVTLELSERVVVTLAGGIYTATHCDEPALPDLTGPTGWSMEANGVEVVQ
ncbi:MAG: phage tail protein [Denitratisoma sp.]|nr:phage tail protein [Denitratisoma sp.]